MVGKCDFVMANPPFNVDGVDKERDYVRNDPRLPFGLPRNDNANYLWIQYFYSYLNETGRAGFVMASSASDAGHSEKTIREALVNTGAVDVMVSIGTKFFYTRSLPCTLWFFDRSKESNKKRSDKTLMLDLREVYRKVSSNLHDFTPEHLKSIHAIVGLYRGNSDHYKRALTEHDNERKEALDAAANLWSQLAKIGALDLEVNLPDVEHLKTQKRTLINAVKSHIATLKEESKASDRPTQLSIRQTIQSLEELVTDFHTAADTAIYFHKEYNWLESRFPNGRYVDVPGLCKVVTREVIANNDFSLTPGRYVGVAPHIDDDFDYEERMAEIKIELQGLNEESTELAQRIQDDLNELGL